MQSLFPELFFLDYFAVGVVRIAIGLLFLYEARKSWMAHGKISALSVISGIVGLLLTVGGLTQGAALAAILYTLLVHYRKIHTSVFFVRSTASLAVAILLLLAVSGAGGLSLIDLPY